MESYNFLQGQVKVDNLTLINSDKEAVDLVNLCSNIKLYENIKQPFVSGRITLVDGLDLIKNYRIVGQESLTVRIRGLDDTQDGFTALKDSIDRTFRIYAITHERPLNNVNDTKVYVLHFIDPAYFTCRQTRISKVLRGSYSSMLVETWREYVFGNNAPTDDITDWWEESEPENKQLLVPNWTINQLIEFIEKSASPKNATFKNSMFFFDTVYGQQKFMSYDNMKTLKCPVSMDSYPRKTNIGTSKYPVNSPFVGLNTQILKYTRPIRANLMNAIQVGTFTAKIKSYDAIRKVEKTIKHNLSEVYEKIKNVFPSVRFDKDGEKVYTAGTISDEGEIEILGKGYAMPFLDDSADKSGTTAEPLVVNKINATNAYSNDAMLLNSETDTSISQNWVGEEFKDTGPLERNALLQILEQQVTSILIPFRPDIMSGTVIECVIPTEEDDENPNLMNKGEYLITACVFDIQPIKSSGTIHVKCVKEGYDEDIANFEPLKTTTQAYTEWTRKGSM